MDIKDIINDVSPRKVRRFTVVLPAELGDDLNALVPHGMKRHLIAALVRTAINAVKRYGPDVALGAFMSGQYRFVVDKYEDEAAAPRKVE